MLRLFYRGLLRFHPSRFRERFAEEMLSIFDHVEGRAASAELDRKSTRLNSSHGYISYAVFCLKKKKKKLVCRTSHRRQSAIRTPHLAFSEHWLGDLQKD